MVHTKAVSSTLLPFTLLPSISRLSYLADLLGIRWDACRKIHRATGWMAVALLSFHIVEKLPVTVSLFLTPDRSVDPPSPQVLAIHSAIGRILHLSAAGEYINDYIRDLEEMKGGEVMHDGSKPLDDYV
ncbi:hypothetical protein ASPBRDRAFT_34075 [Aspergillus brasiliensis CBS 101740]|uniref:Uncharacterized protein n=1 Tax=Aspergillus brasiliensis (strain CBS 101740 / IMI 381727 / IBT 21946) TaxID=767769 RepID=A0A1L9U7S0_ASPBC|nr:hypothetical protein ASPBRDRAFT_34075 [Aspergillus brasiliensis CBS 101740]